jgi:hypothetical protein
MLFMFYTLKQNKIQSLFEDLIFVSFSVLFSNFGKSCLTNVLNFVYSFCIYAFERLG